tara:strand:- start:11081 stop:11578 length:498 start_codon:yes stop_codon:yes gene_type:complete
MRYLKIICVIFLVLGCQKANKKHIAIGTWNKCHKDGSYSEYKITDKYVINLTTGSDEVWLFQNKIADSTLILSKFKNGLGLLINNDTLVTISQSKSKIVLKSTYNWDKLELNKAEFDYDVIDSTNLKLWKSKTLSEFKKRAKLASCPDLRTEEEKVIPTLNLDDI